MSPAFIQGGAFPPTPAGGSLPSPSPPVSAVGPARRQRQRAAAWVRIPPPPLRFPLPLYVRDFRLVGNKHLPQAVVRDAVVGLVGTRATRSRIFAALRAVDDWFVAKGYVASRVAVAAFPTRENGNVLVVAAVEAVLVNVRTEAVDEDGAVDPEIDVRTRVDVVSRALGIKVGSVFRWHPNAFQRLWALGVFEFARAELEFFGAAEVGVVVSLREKRRGKIEPGLGISSDGSSYGDLSVVDENLLGRAMRLKVEWQRRIGMERSKGGIEFEDPRIGARIPFAVRGRVYRDGGDGRRGMEMGGDPTGAPEERMEREREREGVMIEMGWSPMRYPRLSLGSGPVLERIAPLPGFLDGQPEHQAMWISNATLDLTEVAPTPRKGRRLSLEWCFGRGLDVAGRPNRRRMSGEVFQRAVLKVNQYLPIGKEASIAVGGAVGAGSENLPWHEQKALGGIGSVRGYYYGELGRSPTFGTGRIELRIPLVTPVDDAEGDDKAENGEGPQGMMDPRGAGARTASKKERPFAGRKAEDGKIVITKDGMRGEGEGDPVGSAGRSGLPKLPSIVGVLFADKASADLLGRAVVGQSHGVGLRIGGIISVEYARTRSGRRPRLHFGIVDRSL